MHSSVHPAPLPAGLRVERAPSGIVITRNWRNMASWALLPIALAAVAVAITVFRAVYGVPWNDALQLLPLVFGLVGVVFLYKVILRLVNVTRLEITPQCIKISDGPLPWWRSSDVSAGKICRIEVRPYRWRYNGREVTYYHVWAVHIDGKETCLLERDTDSQQANSTRDEMQRVLGAGISGKAVEDIQLPG